MRVIKEKDERMQALIRENDDIKNKYIIQLEAQLKQKDDMLSEMIRNLTEITQRSLSFQPSVHRFEIRESQHDLSPGSPKKRSSTLNKQICS